MANAKRPKIDAGEARRAMPRNVAAADDTIPAGRIERRQGTSLNHQIFLVMRDRIMNGQYDPGQLLPGEEELARLFAVSRVTIRSAMATLEAERLIERRQGVGTFVSSLIRSTQLHAPVADVIDHIADIDRKTTVRLIEFDYVKAPLHIQSMFGCESNAVFQRAVRLRSIGTKAIFYVTTFLPQEIAKEFTRDELDGTSLYKLLQRSGIRLHSGNQVVSAQLADPTVAPLLDVNVGAPLLQIRRQHFDKDSKPIEYFEMLASPTMFELYMTLDADNLST